MSQNLSKHIGWGLVGTPKGRRQTNEGANKHYQVNFDLDQMIGGVMPNPAQANHDDALYCLNYDLVQDAAGEQAAWQLALALYLPIFEQGQNRAGGYFGSFINVFDATFDSDASRVLINEAFKLALFQYDHFIDPKTKTYKNTFVGCKISISPDAFAHIARSLKSLQLSGTSIDIRQQSDLYIYCQSPDDIVAALQSLLSGRFYERYRRIFFSSSQHIAKRVQQDGKMIFWHVSELKLRADERQNTLQDYADYIQKLKHENAHQGEQYKQEIVKLQQVLQQAKESEQKSSQLAGFGIAMIEAVKEKGYDIQGVATENLAPSATIQKLNSIEKALQSLQQQSAGQGRFRDVGGTADELETSSSLKIPPFVAIVVAVVVLASLALSFFGGQRMPSEKIVKKHAAYLSLQKEKNAEITRLQKLAQQQTSTGYGAAKPPTNPTNDARRHQNTSFNQSKPQTEAVKK